MSDWGLMGLRFDDIQQTKQTLASGLGWAGAGRAGAGAGEPLVVDKAP